LPCLLKKAELQNQNPTAEELATIETRRGDLLRDMPSLPLTHPVPGILDIHTSPCLIHPDYLGCDPEYWSRTTMEATATFNALAALRLKTNPSATMMLGETHGNTQQGCRLCGENDPPCSAYAGVRMWDPSVVQASIAGFNASLLAGSGGATIFRPWEYLQAVSMREDRTDISNVVACFPVTVSPPYATTR
jgi:hypothetical protein